MTIDPSVSLPSECRQHGCPAANTPGAGNTRVGTVLDVTRVLSCMQPTGDVHLGNYLGALRNWAAAQHEVDAFHGIVDLHALTVTEEPGIVGQRTVELAAMLLRHRPRPRRRHGVRPEPRARAQPAGVGDGVQRQLRRAVRG